MKHKEMHHSKSHVKYENEIEKPSVPKKGSLEHGMGMHEFKKEADPIAYGQASGPGCKSDSNKIHSQMKQYHWD